MPDVEGQPKAAAPASVGGDPQPAVSHEPGAERRPLTGGRRFLRRHLPELIVMIIGGLIVGLVLNAIEDKGATTAAADQVLEKDWLQADGAAVDSAANLSGRVAAASKSPEGSQGSSTLSTGLALPDAPPAAAPWPPQAQEPRADSGITAAGPVEITPPSPARLLARSPDCPARFVRLRFEKPEFSDRFFRSLTGSEMVEMGPCDKQTGDFGTRLNAGLGPLPNTSGSIDASAITFDFGHLTNFTHDRHIRCSVTGSAETPFRRYRGRLSCLVINDDETLGPLEVIIEL